MQLKWHSGALCHNYLSTHECCRYIALVAGLLSKTSVGNMQDAARLMPCYCQTCCMPMADHATKFLQFCRSLLCTCERAVDMVIKLESVVCLQDATPVQDKGPPKSITVEDFLQGLLLPGRSRARHQGASTRPAGTYGRRPTGDNKTAPCLVSGNPQRAMSALFQVLQVQLFTGLWSHNTTCIAVLSIQQQCHSDGMATLTHTMLLSTLQSSPVPQVRPVYSML